MRVLLGWASTVVIVVMLFACTSDTSTSGQTSDTTSSSSSSSSGGGSTSSSGGVSSSSSSGGATSSSSSGGTTECGSNVTASTAEAFSLGPQPVLGAVCAGDNDYFYWKSGGVFHREDLFTVHIRLLEAPPDGKFVAFAIGSKGEWSSAEWATTTAGSGLYGSHMEDTLTDIPGAVNADGDTAIFLIATDTLRGDDPPVPFEFTVERQ